MTSPTNTTPSVMPDPPPPMRPSRLVLPILLIMLVVAAGFGVVRAAAWMGGSVREALESRDEEDVIEVVPGNEVSIEIPAGSTAEDIGELLVEAGVIGSSRQFESAVETAGVANSLKAGSFDLVTGMNPDAVINTLIAGPTVRVYKVTIPEGLRVTEILELLAEESGIERGEFEEALFSGQVTTTLHTIPAEPTFADWEGLLFPDTYEFSEQSSASDILNRLARTMQVRMESVDWTAFEEAGFSRHEGIIIASLIESEVQVAEERPLVSSVIRNRLEIGEILGIDASTLYAQGIRAASEIDVDFDSPYNTRRYGGIPPGPISAPGLASLEATANPADSDFLYYVLADADGTHVFAETLEEHNANVAISREAGLLG
ncbi:MAG: endolytic transglycosylase MltG [Acidimicrobiia bacterium]